MPSPVKESIPNLPPPITTELQAPPSPRTHRALRRLQSAHSLGAKAANPPSLISQQRLREQQQQQQQQLHHHLHRNGSPVRRDLSAGNNRSPQRGRANSDAPIVHHLSSLAAKRKRTNAAANGLSLQQLLRDGPPDGDVAGALESARVKILDEGIRSDSDGMVGVL
jgi:cell cycle arrest protein BUB2